MFLILVGCSSLESVNLATAGMYAEYTVTSTGASTELRASFRTGDGLGADSVELVDGDTVYATVDGQDVPLSERGAFGRFEYVADVDTPEDGTAFIFALERSSQDGAPASSVQLPPTLEILAPTAGGDAFDDDGSLTVTWAPHGGDDPIDVSVSGGCIDGDGAWLDDDPGTYTFDGAAFESTGDEEGAASCEIIVSVSRLRNGTVDVALNEGSTISAIQRRNVTLPFSAEDARADRGCATAPSSRSALWLATLGAILGAFRRRTRSN